MKKSIQALIMAATMLAGPMVFTSCEEILGEWSRPAPNPVTPTPEPDPTLMLKTPLTLEAAVAGAKVTFKANNDNVVKDIEYSTDGGATWTSGNTGGSGVEVTLTNIGDKVMFRGDNSQYGKDNGSNPPFYNTISCTADCYVYGNIMSLIDKTGFATNKVLPTGTYTFYNLFKDNTHLKNHPNAAYTLELPATTLKEYCYCNMFFGCAALVTPPALPATKLENSCYNAMFRSCFSMVTPPALPATELKNNCYQSMFDDCASLETTPRLPATELKKGCYNAMFKGCTSLKEAWVKANVKVGAPDDECDMMFYGCTNASTSKFYTDGTWSDWKTAFSNIDLWTKYSYTPGLAAGKFTINADGDQIQFAQGNLQATYDGSAWTWSFAEHQYDYIGNAAGNTSVTGAAPWISAPGTVDLFGWSTANTYFGINNSTDEATYSGDFVDWGTLAISNGGNMPNSGWRTLTNNEWLYLLKTRTVNGGNGEGKSYTLGQNVNGKLGIVIYPDGYASSVYAGSDWATFEAAGCVFLPAAGYRTDTTVQNVDDRGHYWSSSSNNPIYAKPFCFTSNSMITDALSDRKFGFSVRLVRDVVD